jgi:hypothetical protein
MNMATIENQVLGIHEPRHQGQGISTDLETKAEHHHFQFVEKRRAGTIDCASIQYHGDGGDTGRVVLFQLREGIQAVINFDTMARGIALDFRSNKGNHVDFFQIPEHGATSPGESSYAGQLALKESDFGKNYEFDSMIAGFSCTAIRKRSSVLRYLLMDGARVIGSFKMQPSSLDLSIREIKQTRDAFLLLGIAFSIWRLIPCT